MVQNTQDKKYSFASSTRVGDVLGQIGGVDTYAANATIQGFIASDPVVREMADGRKVLNISVPLNNTGKKITGALGFTDKADETLWIRASIFDSEHIPAATRAEKVLKKGQLIVLNGLVKAEEYNGKLYYNMNVNDFKISWSKEMGKTVGGKYSFVSARKANKEGNSIVGFEGFIGGEPEVKTTTGGKEVLSFPMAFNKATSKLNFPLGIKSDAQDVNWVTINVWDNDNFNLKERAQKVLKKGMGIIGHGLMSAQEGEKGYFYNLNLSDFEIVRGVGETNQSQGQAQSEAFDAASLPLDEDVPF